MKDWARDLPPGTISSSHQCSDVSFRPTPEGMTLHTKGKPTFLSALDTRTKADSQADGIHEDLVGESCVVSSELGHGSMGVVYSATQVGLQRLVAVKVIRADLMEEEQSRRDFLSAAKVAAELEHPNIIPIHMLAAADDGSPALVMKQVEGVSWADKLQDEPNESLGELSEESWRIFRSVCNAVDFAHSKGVLHLDIKTDNILVGSYGEVLLVDWGIARGFGNFERHTEILIPHCSEINQICGTPAYMAPEMVMGQGDSFGPWTDTYQLGNLLYLLLEGTTANSVNSNSIDETLKNVVRGDAPSFSSGAPDGLQKICCRALSLDPKERYLTVKALLDALVFYRENRKSESLTDSAIEILAGLEFNNKNDAKNETFDIASLYQAYITAISTLDSALELWPENKRAKQRSIDAKLAYAGACLEAGDIQMASVINASIDDAKAEELKRAIEEAQVEVEKARRAKSYFRSFQLWLMLSVSIFMGGAVALSWLVYSSKVDVGNQVHRDLEKAGVDTLEIVARDSANGIGINLEYAKTQLEAFAFQVERELKQSEKAKAGLSASSQGISTLKEVLRTGRRQPSLGGTVFFPAGESWIQNLQAMRIVEELEPTLSHLTRHSHSIVFLTYLAFAEGLYFLYPQIEGTLSKQYDARQRPWYKDAIKSGGVWQSPLYFGAVSKQPVLSFVHRLLDEKGDVLGVVGIDCLLSDLMFLPPMPSQWREQAKTRLLRFKFEEKTSVVFDVVASQELKEEGHNGILEKYDIELGEVTYNKNASIQKMLRDIKNGLAGVILPGETGADSYQAYAPVGDSGDVLVISIPSLLLTEHADEFIDILDKRTKSSLLYLALIALAVSLVVFGLRRRFSGVVN